MILTITYLAVTELVLEFVWNSMDFHLMSNLNTYWVPYYFCVFLKRNDIIVSFHFISTKRNNECQTSPKKHSQKKATPFNPYYFLLIQMYLDSRYILAKSNIGQRK
jgi:hypothetical protein